MKRIALFSAVAVLTLTTLASASSTTPIVNRQEFTVGKGDIETNFAMVPQFIRGDAHVNFFNLTLGGNYFLTDMLAPGIELDYAHAAGINTVQFLPNLKAYWPLHQRILPYVQVGMGWEHITPADLFDLRIAPGVDFMLSNSVAIGFSFRYDLGTGSGTIHNIAFPLQFAIYFKL